MDTHRCHFCESVWLAIAHATWDCFYPLALSTPPIIRTAVKCTILKRSYYAYALWMVGLVFKKINVKMTGQLEIDQ